MRRLSLLLGMLYQIADEEERQLQVQVSIYTHSPTRLACRRRMHAYVARWLHKHVEDVGLNAQHPDKLQSSLGILIVILLFSKELFSSCCMFLLLGTFFPPATSVTTGLRANNKPSNEH